MSELFLLLYVVRMTKIPHFIALLHYLNLSKLKKHYASRVSEDEWMISCLINSESKITNRRNNDLTFRGK